MIAPDQEDRFREMWADLTVSKLAMCLEFGCGERALRRLAMRRGLPNKANARNSAFWTAERKRALVEAAGMFTDYESIARHVGGGCNRNMVSGQMRRTGLAKPRPKRERKPKILKAPVVKRDKYAGASVSAALARRSRNPKTNNPFGRNGIRTVIGGGGMTFDTVPGREPWVVVKAEAWTPLPGIEPVAFAERHGVRCRWPVETGKEGHWCCGDKAEPGLPYCPTHTTRSMPRPDVKAGMDKRLEIPKPLRVKRAA